MSDPTLSHAEAVRSRYLAAIDKWYLRPFSGALGCTGMRVDKERGFEFCINVERAWQAKIATVIARRVIPGEPFSVQVIGRVYAL